MMQCGVCGEANDDLATTCVKCGGFLQSKVETLDLFHTLWGLMENPGRTFRTIVLARRKNYVFVLSAVTGIAIVFWLFWLLNLGRHFRGIIEVMGFGLALGPPAGIAVLGALGMAHGMISRVLGGRGGVRNSFAVLAYACAPIVFSAVMVLPLEVAIFGIYFFDKNPHPLVINPVPYVALLGLDVVAVAWTLYLLWRGTRVSSGLGRGKSGVIALATGGVFGGAAWLLKAL